MSLWREIWNDLFSEVGRNCNKLPKSPTLGKAQNSVGYFLRWLEGYKRRNKLDITITKQVPVICDVCNKSSVAEVAFNHNSVPIRVYICKYCGYHNMDNVAIKTLINQCDKVNLNVTDATDDVTHGVAPTSTPDLANMTNSNIPSFDGWAGENTQNPTNKPSDLEAEVAMEIYQLIVPLKDEPKKAFDALFDLFEYYYKKGDLKRARIIWLNCYNALSTADFPHKQEFEQKSQEVFKILDAEDTIMEQINSLSDTDPLPAEEDSNGGGLRPTKLSQIYGNEDIIADLKVVIASSRERGEPLDNILLFGPPGLGKTTLASVIATERGVDFIPTLATTLKNYDIINILKNITPFTILFIDEIHDLNKSAALTLYTAMEDGYIDVIDNGDAQRLELPPFTVIGATTHPGKLTAAMRSRFTNKYTLSLYDENTLCKIIARAARALDTKIDKEAIHAIACRSRGTPRNAIALLKKARSYSDYHNRPIDTAIAQMAFQAQDIDEHGLTSMDRKYLQVLNEIKCGGLDTIAASMGDAEDNLESMIEPWLLAQGYIRKTRKGREITPKGIQVITNSSSQDD